MRVRAALFSLSLIAILALAGQGVPVAQQDAGGQAGRGRGGGGGGQADADGQAGRGRGRGAGRTEAERNYVPPVRGPLNKTVNTRPVTDAMLRNPDPGDWLMFRRTYDGQSYSPLDRINRNNVKDLELVWSWGIEKGASPNVDDWVGPIVHDGVMYLSMPGGIVHALDAATGDFLWQYRHPMARGTSPGATGGIRGGIVLYGDKA